MALTNRYKSSNTGGLNLAASWVGGIVPSSASDRAVWDTNSGSLTSSPLGANATWGQLQVLPGTTTNPYNITATSSTILTLTPSDPDAAGVGIDLSQATRNFTISNAVGLGRDQTWLLGDAGSAARILTTSGVVSGAYSLAITGPGKWVPGAVTVNTFGGAGKTFTVSGGAFVQPQAVSTLGNNATTVLVVGEGGCIDFANAAITPTQNTILITGSGNFDYTTVAGRLYGALRVPALTSAKTIEIHGSNAVIGAYRTTLAAKVTGSVTGTLEIMANDSSSVATRLTFVGNDFVAPGGLLISSQTASGKVANNYGYNVGATDAEAGTNETTVFGDVSNSVRVLPSGKIYALVSGTNTRTINRAVTFDGRSSGEAVHSGTAAPDSTLAFAGPVVFSGTVRVQSNTGFVSFRNTVSGTGPMVFVNTSTRVEFDSTETDAFSNWSGSITLTGPAVVQYGNGFNTLVNQVSALASSSVPAVFNNKLAQNITLSHSSYSFADDVQLSATNAGYTFSLGNGSVNGTSGTVFIAAAGVTAVFPGNISSQLIFGKSTATGTCVVSGTNTRTTGTIGWQSGNLCLNSARALGNGSAAADNIVFSGGPVAGTLLGFLDNTSGSPVVLENGGVKQLDSDFSWAGSNDLDLGPGTTTYSTARTFTFTNGGGTKTLTIPSAGTTTTTRTWNVGGGTAGARQRLFLNGGNASLATTGSVTAGYYRINSASGLGNSGITGQWTVSSGAALELVSTTPSQNKEVIITGSGPQTDGVLRSVSGTSVWEGYISVPVQSPASPTRIQVDAGTFTLSRSVITEISITLTGTPLDFTAFGSTARLNQQRTLNNKVSDIRINNGGLGIVELSAANAHTGGTTCEGGTTRVTHPTATSTGTVQVNAAATLESTVQSTFTTLSLGTTSSLSRAILKFAA